MLKEYHTEKNVELECFYTMFEVTYDSGYVFPGETHDFWELLYVMEGEVCVSADERVYQLSRGEIIFHKPMELHKFYIESGKSAALFIMSFSASGALMERLKNSVLRLSEEQKKQFFYMISFLRRNYDLLSGCSGCLVELERNPIDFQVFTCMAELFLLSLSENRMAISTIEDTAETVAYRKAMQIMEKRVNEWISVPEIAAECHVSVSYLKNIFAKYAGLGIHKYFLKTKLIYASRMLKEGKSVSETAAALSFSSPNYFSTVYKRETGISPFAYKNSLG